MNEEDFAATAGHVYAASFYGGAIVEVSSTPPRTIARGIPMLATFAIADRTGYAWSQRDFLVHRVDLATGKVTALWRTGLATSDELLVDGDWLYACRTIGDGAELVRIARDGHELQVLAEHVQGAPIASDAEAIYVGDVGGSAILRFDKARIAPLRVTGPANVAR